MLPCPGCPLPSGSVLGRPRGIPVLLIFTQWQSEFSMHPTCVCLLPTLSWPCARPGLAQGVSFMLIDKMSCSVALVTKHFSIINDTNEQYISFMPFINNILKLITLILKLSLFYCSPKLLIFCFLNCCFFPLSYLFVLESEVFEGKSHFPYISISLGCNLLNTCYLLICFDWWSYVLSSLCHRMMATNPTSPGARVTSELGPRPQIPIVPFVIYC